MNSLSSGIFDSILSEFLAFLRASGLSLLFHGFLACALLTTLVLILTLVLMEQNENDQLILVNIFGYDEVMRESEYISLLRDRDLLDL